jgi:hypothetical protein
VCPLGDAATGHCGGGGGWDERWPTASEDDPALCGKALKFNGVDDSIAAWRKCSGARRRVATLK